MEVKEIYLNEKKVEKKGKTTFIIEDDGGERDLTLKIGYDDKDKSYLEQIKSEVESKVDELNESMVVYEHKEEEATDLINKYSKEILLKDKLIKKLESEIESRDKIINGFSSIQDKQNKQINSLNEELIHLKEKQAEFEQKLPKQPILYHDKIFISGNEEVMLGVYDIPDGDYLQILSVRIGEHNEHCDNKDEVIMARVYSQDGFTPRYCLYGGTGLDTPTAMVFYDLVLIPL